jgi:hypothetical protein
MLHKKQFSVRFNRVPVAKTATFIQFLLYGTVTLSWGTDFYGTTPVLAAESLARCLRNLGFSKNSSHLAFLPFEVKQQDTVVTITFSEEVSIFSTSIFQNQSTFSGIDFITALYPDLSAATNSTVSGMGGFELTLINAGFENHWGNNTWLGEGLSSFNLTQNVPFNRTIVLQKIDLTIDAAATCVFPSIDIYLTHYTTSIVTAFSSFTANSTSALGRTEIVFAPVKLNLTEIVSGRLYSSAQNLNIPLPFATHLFGVIAKSTGNVTNGNSGYDGDAAGVYLHFTTKPK